MTQTNEKRSREKSLRATAHAALLDRLWDQVPERKPDCRVEITLHQLARIDSRIDTAPEDLFSGGIDDGKHCRTQQHQGRGLSKTACKDGHRGPQGRKQQQEQPELGRSAQWLSGTTEEASESGALHDPERKSQTPDEPVADKAREIADLWSQ